MLIALDDSIASKRALEYTVDLATRHAARVVIFHALPPMPPELREHPGAENPRDETALENDYAQRREMWMAHARERVRPLLKHARDRLQDVGISASSIDEVAVSPDHKEDLSQQILSAAESRDCDMIILGRSSYPWYRELFTRHVADAVMRAAEGLELGVLVVV